MRSYRNPTNAARGSEVGRDALVGEAGEVFTPPEVVEKVLSMEAVRSAILDPHSSIVEPAAGDGNFFLPLLEERLRPLLEAGASTDELVQATANLFAVELQPDNHAALLERVECLWDTLCPALGAAARNRLRRQWSDNLLEGNFLTRHASLIPCAAGCGKHSDLNLPDRFSLVVGNPPYNPGLLYRDFLLTSLAAAPSVVFILPTTWKLSGAHQKLRAATLPRLSSLEDLPWSTFAIKLHTCIAAYGPGESDSFLLNGVKSAPLDGDRMRVGNSILGKAYRAWPDRLEDFQVAAAEGPAALHIGWKCNLGRDGLRVNALQSISHRRNSKLLPNNVFSFAFSSERARRNYTAYSSTKLAAYLQSLTDSDTVARHLPIPPLLANGRYRYGDDGFLQRQLGLNQAEVAEVERHVLTVSAKAQEYYEEMGIVLREDAVLGKPRRSCPACGSSSFHRKGCPHSTQRERELRDGEERHLFTEEELAATVASEEPAGA